MNQMRYAITFADHAIVLDKLEGPAPTPILPVEEGNWHLIQTNVVHMNLRARLYWTWASNEQAPESMAFASRYGSRTSSRPSPEGLGKWVHDLALPILRRSNSIEDAVDVASRLRDSVAAELSSLEAWEKISQT